MSALGKLPPVDYAIHADTGWERTETYEFAEKWTPWLEEHDVKVVMVKDEQASNQIVDSHGSIFCPAFTTYEDGTPSGMLRRQCTDRWKIAPIRRWLSGELARRNLGKTPSIVEQWLGFTLDEAHRAKDSHVQYIEHVHPFLEMLERPYTRGMVIQWLRKKELEVPVKSACIFCPFHAYHQWREIQMADNGDWEKAIEVDRAIRHKRPGYLCYLCDDRKPLEQHDFTQQLSYW